MPRRSGRKSRLPVQSPKCGPMVAARSGKPGRAAFDSDLIKHVGITAWHGTWIASRSSRFRPNPKRSSSPQQRADGPTHVPYPFPDAPRDQRRRSPRTPLSRDRSRSDPGGADVHAAPARAPCIPWRENLRLTHQNRLPCAGGSVRGSGSTAGTTGSIRSGPMLATLLTLSDTGTASKKPSGGARRRSATWRGS